MRPWTRSWRPASCPRTSAGRVEELIEEEEGATNRLGGWLGKAMIGFAVFVSIFHLYAAAAGCAAVLDWTPIVPTYTAAAPARRHGAGADLHAVSDAPGLAQPRDAARLAVCRRQPRPSSPTSSSRAPSSATGPSIPTRSISTSASS